MSSKCFNIIRIVILHITIFLKFAISFEAYDDYSRYYPQNFIRTARESSFFPDDDVISKNTERTFRYYDNSFQNTDSNFRFDSASANTEPVFRFKNSKNSPESVINETISSRSVNTNNNDQWSYNLPIGVGPDFRQRSASSSNKGPPLRHSARKSKLTSEFTNDLIIPEEPKESSTVTDFESQTEDYQFRVINRFQAPDIREDTGSRRISPEAIAKFTETLGAINTVGRYLVNYTRGGAPPQTGDRFDPQTKVPKTNEDLPKAIYTISKNVLGRNMTDTIAPIVRPLVTLTSGKIETHELGGGIYRPCSTPDGSTGNCGDLSDCPELLLNLSHLRQSICFKSIFVPGVCCPRKSSNEFLSTERPRPTFGVISQTTVPTTRRPLILTTSKIPLLPITTKPTTVVITTTTAAVLPLQPTISTRIDDCGLAKVEKFRVVGGDEALPGRWPWMAAIFLHGPRRTEFWCGGALIGQKYILTAAHCTRDSRQRPFNAHQFTVRLGDVDLRRDDEPSSPDTYYVTDVRAHEKFSRIGFYNDIAVLVLDRPVRKSRYIVPLCLPTQSLRHERFIGQKPTVVGWGTTYYGGKESSIQRQVELPVWKNEDCDRTYFQPITENFICAGLKEGGKDACQGDSGGPLMIKREGRWMQIGIVSFGNKCGEPGYPGVYTRVTQYLDWIQENMV